MKRFVIGGLVAAALMIAGSSVDAWAQACTNSGQVCGKCNGGAGAINVQDARQGLLIAADVFGIIADVEDGFCDTDFDQDVDVNDARQILLKAADVFGLIDSCATGDQTLAVRVRTTDDAAFGADARINVPTGFDENAATGTPIGGATTVCDTNNTNCRIAAINPDSAGGTIRFGVATTLGFAQSTNRVGTVTFNTDMTAAVGVVNLPTVENQGAGDHPDGGTFASDGSKTQGSDAFTCRIQDRT